MGTPWVGDVLVALLLVLHLVGVGCSAPGLSTNEGPLVNAKGVMVVGKAACSDCPGENLHGGVSFKGLQVTIVCKSSSGKYQAQGVSAFDKSGRFAVSLPRSILDSAGRLKHECFAQLFDPSNSSPCPTHADPQHFKIVPQPEASAADADADLHLFTTATPTLRFSRSACASDIFFWPFPKHPFHPWFRYKRRHHHHRRCSRRHKGHHRSCSCKHRRRGSKRRHYPYFPKHPPFGKFPPLSLSRP